MAFRDFSRLSETFPDFPRLVWKGSPMAAHKPIRTLRQSAVRALIALALVIVVAIAIPGLRSHLAKNLAYGANMALVDGDEPGDKARPDDQMQRKSSTMERIATAPFRFFAGLFKKKDGNDDLMVKKPKEQDAEKMKIIPMNRTQDGVPGDADSAGGSGARAANEQVAAQALFIEALELHEKERTEDAIKKLVAATILQPDFAEAYNLLAVCYDEKGRYRNAQEEYKKALKVDSRNARFMNNLGYSYYLSADYEDAIKCYSKGLRIAPKDRRLHNNLGLAYGRNGDYGKARAHFLIAVGEAGANLNLGYVYSQQNRLDEAIRHYRMALYLEPQSLIALNSLVQLYERTGRPKESAMLNDQYQKLVASIQQKEQAVE
jgi:Flp pilus assembly protein TadD